MAYNAIQQEGTSVQQEPIDNQQECDPSEHYKNKTINLGASELLPPGVTVLVRDYDGQLVEATGSDSPLEPLW